MPSACIALSRPQIQRETRHLEMRGKREAHLRGNAPLVAAEQDLAQAVSPRCACQPHSITQH